MHYSFQSPEGKIILNDNIFALILMLLCNVRICSPEMSHHCFLTGILGLASAVMFYIK